MGFPRQTERMLLLRPTPVRELEGGEGSPGAQTLSWRIPREFEASVLLECRAGRRGPPFSGPGAVGNKAVRAGAGLWAEWGPCV